MESLSTLANVTDRVGRYQIVAELGRGAMSQVYLAVDPNIEREIALKVFMPRYPVGPDELAEMRRRFIEEAKAAGRVRHPGIVTIYDADTDLDRDLSYIAMERIEGRSLGEILAEDGPMPELPAVEIVAKVALALHTAHEEGLIHLDVKPGNILLSLDGSVKVTDFGIAQRAKASRDSPDWISGSPFYMAPEQLAGDDVDARSDVYGLGAVLYECLSGAVPFTSESLAGLRYMIAEIDPRPLQTYDARIRGELACVAMKALSKSPADRFRTTLDLAQALASAMAVAPILVSSSEAPRSAAPVPVDAGSVAGVGSRREPGVGAVSPDLAPPESRPSVAGAPKAPRAKRKGSRARRGSARALLLGIALGIAGLVFWLGRPPDEPLRAASESPPSEPTVAQAPSRVVLTRVPRYEAPAAVPLAARGSVVDDSTAGGSSGADAAPSSRESPRGSSRRSSRGAFRGGSALAAFDLPDPPPAPSERAAEEEARRTAQRQRRLAIEEIRNEAIRSERAEKPLVEGSVLSAEELAPVPVAAAPEPMATLEIVFRNRLRGGAFEVWIDGESVFSRSFAGAGNVFRRTVGKDVEVAIPLRAGDREIEVRVTGLNGRLDEVLNTRAAFAADETRRLRLIYVPLRGIKLSWKGDPGE